MYITADNACDIKGSLSHILSSLLLVIVVLIISHLHNEVVDVS